MANINTDKIKQDYFTFDGSINKQTYLISFLILLGIGVVAKIVLSLLGAVGGFLFLIISIGLAVAHFSIAIRRFHDLGKTGWLSLLLIIPFVNIIVIIYLCVADKPGVI